MKNIMAYKIEAYRRDDRGGLDAAIKVGKFICIYVPSYDRIDIELKDDRFSSTVATIYLSGSRPDATVHMQNVLSSEFDEVVKAVKVALKYKQEMKLFEHKLRHQSRYAGSESDIQKIASTLSQPLN